MRSLTYPNSGRVRLGLVALALVLGLGAGAGAGAAQTNDAVLSINDVSICEPDTGDADMTFTVTLSRPPNYAVTVEYDTFFGDGDSNTPPDDLASGSADNSFLNLTPDYQSARGMLAFGRHETVQQITIKVRGDLLAEHDERFRVGLSNATRATFADGDNVAIGTIINDDPVPAEGSGCP